MFIVDSVSLVLREALDLGGEANNEGLVKRDLLILYIVIVAMMAVDVDSG